MAMMFVRLSVSLSGTGVHCDHAVYFSAHLSLRLDSPMLWAPWHQRMSTYSLATSKALECQDINVLTVYICEADTFYVKG